MPVSLSEELRTAAVAQWPLMAATEQGRLSLLTLDDDQSRVSISMLNELLQPTIANLVSNLGPGRNNSASVFRKWGSFAIIHSTAPRESDYRWMIGVAEKHRRLVIVETMPNVAMTWLAFMQKQIPAIAMIGKALP